MSAVKSTTTPEFVLVYDSKAAPKSLHARTEQECWKGHMREATAEEQEGLKEALCKHCVSRVERLQAAEAKAAS